MYDYEAYYNYYETADWPTPEGKTLFCPYNYSL